MISIGSVITSRNHIPPPSPWNLHHRAYPLPVRQIRKAVSRKTDEKSGFPFSVQYCLLPVNLEKVYLFLCTYFYLLLICSNESQPLLLVIRMKRYLPSRVAVQGDRVTHNQSLGSRPLSCEPPTPSACPDFFMENIELWYFFLGHTHCLLVQSH